MCVRVVLLSNLEVRGEKDACESVECGVWDVFDTLVQICVHKCVVDPGPRESVSGAVA